MSLNGASVELMPLEPVTITGTEALRHFRTRIESWSNVLAHYLYYEERTGNTTTTVLSDQVDYWEVWSKSGERYYFGPLNSDVPSAYCVDYLVPPNPQQGVPRRNQWMLRRVEDVDDNTMDYSYCQGRSLGTSWSSAGSLLPDEISYGGNSATSYSHFAKVRFTWEERPDKRFSYFYGIRQDIADRLSKVEVLFNGGVQRSYFLHYDVSAWTGQSRLRSVTINAPDATYPKVEYQYSDATGAQPIEWVKETGGPYDQLPGLPLTANFFRSGTGDTNFAGTRSNGAVFIDINGDGLPDKLDALDSYDAGTGKPGAPVRGLWLNQGPEKPWLDASQSLLLPGEPLGLYYVANQYQHNTLDTGVRFVDVTGDGVPEKIDALSRADGYPGASAVYLGRRDGKGWDSDVLGAVVHLDRGVLPEVPGSEGFTAVKIPLVGGNPLGHNLTWGIVPRSQTAGGRVFFSWKAVPPGGSSKFSVTTRTKLEGYESQWAPSISIANERLQVNLGSRSFSALPAGSYTFKVQLLLTRSNGSVIVEDELAFPLTITSSADQAPPSVHFTDVPEEGFLEQLGFSWTGNDSGGPVTFATWLGPAQDPAPESSNTSAIYPVSQVGLGGTFLLVAFDAAGNMTPIEWAYEGGRLKPMTNTIWKTGDHQTIKAIPQGAQILDVNGDGYADQLFFRSDFYLGSDHPIFSASIFNPSTFQWERSTEWTTGAEPFLQYDTEKDEVRDTGVRLADINGDGLPDLVRYYFDENTHTATRWVRYNIGAGWGPREYLQGGLSDLPGKEFTNHIYQDNAHITNDRGAWLIDFNGDGLTDKVDGWLEADTTYASCPTAGVGLTAFRNGGTGFAWAPLSAPTVSFSEHFRPYPSVQPNAHATRDTGVRVLDINGDGIPDVLRFVEYWQVDGTPPCGLQEVYLGQGRTTADGSGKLYSPKAELLIGVRNPIGGVTHVRYRPALDSYSRIAPDNPNGDFSPGIPYVVSQVIQEDGRGSSYATTYRYSHPLFDVDERQSAGFREVVATSVDGLSSKTTYRQDFPFAGMVARAEAFEALDLNGTPGGNRYQDSTSVYESQVDEFGVWRVRKTQDRTSSTEQPGDPDGPQWTLDTGVNYGPFDEYDNALVVTTLGNLADPADDKEVRTQFANLRDDASRRWLIGFVTQSDTYGYSPETGLAGGIQPTSSKKVFYDGSDTQGTLVRGHTTKEADLLDVRTDSRTRVGFNDYLPTATVTYNQDGTIKERTDAADILTRFPNYDSTHRFPLVKEVVGRFGGVYKTTVTADPWGRPTSTTDAKGVTSLVGYDSLGRVVTEGVQFEGMTSGFATKRNYYHDDLAGLENEQFVETHTYLPQPGGSVTTLISKARFDGLGRSYSATTTSWQGREIITSTIYDAFGRVSAKSRPMFADTRPPSYYTSYEYDRRSRVTRESGFGTIAETQFISPTEVLVATHGTSGVGGANAHTKHTIADAYGRLTWVQHDAMPAVSYEYDVMGALVRAYEDRGESRKLLVELTYDSWGRKLSYQDYDAGSIDSPSTPTTRTEYFYDAAGNLLRQYETTSADPSAFRETLLTYGGDLGQLTSRVGTDDSGAEPLTEALEYYGPSGSGNGNHLDAGELKRRQDLSGVYSFSRSFSNGVVVGQTVAEIAGAPQPFLFREYKDLAGRTIQRDLPEGQEVHYSFYADSGLPAGVTDGAGAALASFTTYDESHLVQWVRANGVRTSYSHDPLTERLTSVLSIKDQDGAVRQALDYSFFTDGQVASVTDSTPAGYSQSFAYDGSLRLTQAQGPYGTLSYQYDDVAGGGRLAAKGSFSKSPEGLVANNLVQLTYDEAYGHRVTATSDGRAFQYDAWGNVVLEVLPSGQRQKFTYDAWNRMTSAARWVITAPPDPRGGQHGEWHTFANYIYDAAGERVRTEHIGGGTPSGVVFYFRSVSASGYEVEEIPVNQGVRTRWAIQGPSGVIAWKQRIAPSSGFYAAVGVLGHRALAGQSCGDLWADAASLVRAKSSRGAAIAAAATVQDSWQAIEHALGAVSADQELQGLLVQGGLLVIGALVALFLVSPQFRRATEKSLLRSQLPRLRSLLKRAGTAPSEGWEGAPLGPWNIPALQHAARLLVLVMLFQGGFLLVPVQTHAELIPCEQTFYPLADHLGSVNILTDSAGNITLEQHFLPFGEDFESPKPTVSTCNAAQSWPYGFTGQFHDFETGLIYYHARYYNPAIGHFMSADSVVPNPSDTFSFDRYGYCRNNPINLTDPTGHFWVALLIAAVKVAAVAAVVGAISAAIQGGNVLQGAVSGFINGFFSAALGIPGAMVAAAINAQIYGGNPLESALIAGVSMGLGIMVGQSGAGALGGIFSSGVIGGALTQARGGNFWDGFVSSAISAGTSYAVNRIGTFLSERHMVCLAAKIARANFPELDAKQAYEMARQALTDTKAALHAKYRADNDAMPIPETEPVSPGTANFDEKTGVVGFSPGDLTRGGSFAFYDVNGNIFTIDLTPKQYIYSIVIHEYLGHVLPYHLTGDSHPDAYKRGDVTSLETIHIIEGIYGVTQLFPDLLRFNPQWMNTFASGTDTGAGTVFFFEGARQYWADVGLLPIGY